MFPNHWQKNANDIFNEILNGQPPENFDQRNLDDATHAAIHRKAFEFNEDVQDDQDVIESPRMPAVTGDRPTSGKHFARDAKFIEKRGSLEFHNKDHQ